MGPKAPASTVLTLEKEPVAGRPGEELENATKENVRLGVEALKTAASLS